MTRKSPARPLVAGALVTIKDLPRAMSLFRKKELDILELRLDAFSGKELIELKGRIVSLKKRPLILVTVRSGKEGGFRVLSDAERRRRFELFRGVADMFDLEASSARLWPVLKKIAPNNLMLSHHDFEKTPTRAVLDKIFMKIHRLRPLLVKMAFTVKTPTDLFTLLDFLKKHRSQNIVLIGMGKAGEASRILFPLLGSRITFGSLGERVSAPGQMPVWKLRKRLLAFSS